jgi:hypothetical protein
LSFETPACQDMSLGEDELNCIESSELAVVEKWQERNRCHKKTTCVICSYSETHRSVSRIRQVETENPSECVTVNCKVFRLAIAL